MKDLTGRELLRVSPCAWLVRLFVITVFGAAVLGLTAHGFAQTQTKRPATPAKSAPAPPQTSPSKEAPEEEQVLATPPGALFPAVVARVNGKAILGRDLEQRIQAQLTPIGNPKWDNLREEYRQELIGQSLGALGADPWELVKLIDESRDRGRGDGGRLRHGWGLLGNSP